MLPTPPRPAVVLLSGGLDSTTCLAIAQHEGYEVHALSFRYGQRHTYELQRAMEIAQRAKVASHVIVDVDLAAIGHSALTDPSIAVPKAAGISEIGEEIPVTYVPARNTIFLALALGFAETLHAQEIFIGVNALDYSGYPDCRPEFIRAFEQMANLATKATIEEHHTIRINAPLIDLSKAEIIARGLALGVDYSQTLSCYDPGEGGVPCGHCDACLLRQQGFEAQGLQDPARR
nr:7-cyano-7-deazaguanine synthase QueC [Candidatus Laterigemmans baculatus]